jgi:hypothetical protein
MNFNNLEIRMVSFLNKHISKLHEKEHLHWAHLGVNR